MIIDDRYINGVILIRDFLKDKSLLNSNDKPALKFNSLLKKLQLDLTNIYNKINNTNIEKLSVDSFFKTATGYRSFEYDHFGKERGIIVSKYSNLNKILREHTLKDIIDDNRL